jgi:flagellar biosynthesis chaperone FliJ
VRKLIERRRHELRQGLEQREQRAADELALRVRAPRNPFAGTQL